MGVKLLKLNILSLTDLPDVIQEQIVTVDPSITLTMAPGWFDGEIRNTWPEFTSNRYLATQSNGKASKSERDALLAQAEITLVGFPFPLDIKVRSPILKWVHQRPAGSSNMLRGDLWGSDITVTSSRGYAHNLPIAEYTLAGILHFAKGLNTNELERKNMQFNASAYQPTQLAGKTICIVGAGGIGKEVGRLCSAVGMRVLGIRRQASTGNDGFEKIYSTADLLKILPESDYVAVCCQWTPETEKLINHKAFKAMKDGAVIINIARGEIIDETALLEALDNNKLRGAVLDVYTGEFEHAPDSRLWKDPRVLITPHISAASDINSHKGNDLFLKNLKRYVQGKKLENVIDWKLGY
jgi:glyoxylate/hydroxypyruvate reductase A